MSGSAEHRATHAGEDDPYARYMAELESETREMNRSAILVLVLVVVSVLAISAGVAFLLFGLGTVSALPILAGVAGLALAVYVANRAFVRS